MNQIIDLEYYSSHFPNPIPDKIFDVVEAQAEVEFNAVVHEYMKADIGEEKIQNCIFQLCNFIYTNRQSIGGKAVSSVSNNGYSESYTLQTPEQTKDAMKELIYSCIGTRLAGAF